ncbi:MAG: hypothetical protein NUW37_15915 [Planctomycetes bacterium]|nr:hypothetical protein [Planctomycetota bacterium]
MNTENQEAVLAETIQKPENSDGAKSSPESFSQIYLDELRAENAKHKAAESELRAKVTTFEKTITSIARNVRSALFLDDTPALETLAARVDEVITDFRGREEKVKSILIKRAFDYLAKDAGIVHVEDAYKLADFSGVSVDIDGGKIIGLEKVVRDIVERKKFLMMKEIPIKTPDDKTEKELYDIARPTGNAADIQKFMEFKRTRMK